jgi:hypothetical protein
MKSDKLLDRAVKGDSLKLGVFIFIATNEVIVEEFNFE